MVANRVMAEVSKKKQLAFEFSIIDCVHIVNIVVHGLVVVNKFDMPSEVEKRNAALRGFLARMQSRYRLALAVVEYEFPFQDTLLHFPQ